MNKVIDFFVSLYDKFISLSFVEKCISYGKAHPVHVAVIGGLILFIIITLCIIGAKRRKAKKSPTVETQQQEDFLVKKDIPAEEVVEAPTIEEVEEPIVEEVKEPTVEELVVEKVEEPIVEEVEEPIVEEVEEPTVEEIEEPIVEEVEELVVEKIEEPAPVEEEFAATEEIQETPEEEIVETPEEEIVEAPEEEIVEAPEEEIVEAPEEEIVEAPPVQIEKKPSRVKAFDEAFEIMDTLDEDAFLQDHYDENEIDRIARYKGKWVICRMITNDAEYGEMFFFELRAAKGEKLLESEEYPTYQGVIRGIQTHKTNILNGNFKISNTRKGDYTFKLLSGKNMLLCTGANYPTRARCESAIDSTIRFAATAILDENVQDIVVRVPIEDDAPVEALPDVCNGKWIISSALNAEGKKIYCFELYTDDGEKLLEGEEYTTYTGAVNGIRTYKKNIENNKFRIALTKRGDYVYKLLNANGQLLCLGDHYRTKKLCQNAVELVKRFAVNAPMLTDENID